jgi:alpha-L-fucosidase 2
VWWEPQCEWFPPRNGNHIRVFVRKEALITDRRSFLRGGLATAVLPQFVPPLRAQSNLNEHELWYTKPAERWLEALPIGNGRLGGMVFGGTAVERIALSELTAWSGAPATGEVNPGALPHLHEIRELFFAGKYDDAQALCREYLPGHQKNFGTNLPLPELKLTFETIDSVADYRRSLNLDEAVARVDYRSGGVSFAREILATHADNVLAMRLTASQPGRIGFRMGFNQGVVPSTTNVSGNATLVLDAHCYESQHSSGHDGVAVQIRAQVILEGGNAAAGDGTIEVRDANAATILMAIGTSYRGADPEELCKRALSNGARKSFAQIREAHLADYQPLYRRMSLRSDRPRVARALLSVWPLPNHRGLAR